MEKIFLFDINRVIFKDLDYKVIHEFLNTKLDITKLKWEYAKSEYGKMSEKGLISMDDFIDTFISKTKSNRTKEEYYEFWKNNKRETYPGTIELIDKLKQKGYKVGVLSNLKKVDIPHVKKLVDTNKLDYEFYSCYLGDMKPNSSIFEYVGNLINIKENEVYFFDDTKENCIEASKQGFITIHTTGDKILNDFKEKVGDIL